MYRQDVEMRDKATMLQVAKDLIRYLKERSTYALQRRSRGRAFSGQNDENGKILQWCGAFAAPLQASVISQSIATKL